MTFAPVMGAMLSTRAGLEATCPEAPSEHAYRRCVVLQHLTGDQNVHAGVLEKLRRELSTPSRGIDVDPYCFPQRA